MQVASDEFPEGLQVSSTLQPASSWFLGLSVLTVAATAMLYLLLALPVNDDWMRSAQPINLGWWPYCKHLYLAWQGRWVAFGSESAALPLRDLPRTYPILIGSVALINLIGVFGVCRFFTRSASIWFSLGCTAGISAVLWAEMPSVAQTIYWFTGTFENAMPIAFSGLLLVGLVSFGDGVFWILIASLFAVVICGIHESYGSMLCIALATGTMGAYWMNSPNKRAWLIVTIAAVIGLAIVVGAPGNRVRMQTDGPKHARHLSAIARLAGAQLWNSGRAWIFDPKLLAAALWVVFSPKLEESRPVWATARRVPFRVLIPLAWLGMLAVGFFAPTYAFADVLPARTLSGNFLVFAIGWLLIVFVWTRNIGTRDTIGPNRLRNSAASAMAKLILAFALLLGGNTLDGIHDLANHQAIKWHNSMEHRFSLLRQPGPDDRVLPRLTATSRMLYDGEIGTDTTDWHNWPLANRFGLKKIRVLPGVADHSATTAPVPVDPGQ